MFDVNNKLNVKWFKNMQNNSKICKIVQKYVK